MKINSKNSNQKSKFPPFIYERRERVFLVLSAFFLSSMTLLNVIGITRFIQMGPLTLAIGVLPYPLTFLCTDLISELFGKKRANFIVLLGFFINLFVIGIIFIGNALPPADMSKIPPWQVLNFSEPVLLPNGEILKEKGEFFYILYSCTRGSVLASMIAYLMAQFCDVYLFHFWKKVTRGYYLWVRNNLSTLVSQMIDSIAVILITFGFAFLNGSILLRDLFILILSSYTFKLIVALIDTLPFYISVHYLSIYLKLNSRKVMS